MPYDTCFRNLQRATVTNPAKATKTKKITYKTSCGRGTLLNPTFRSYDIVNEVVCARLVEYGNLVQLYNYSGYTICSISKEDIIKIED